MLYWLADFSGTISVFNVFRYLTVRTGGSMATAALFVFLFGPWIIDHLRLRQGKGQPIREDGPASHLKTKRGTPTMGGLMILSGVGRTGFGCVRGGSPGAVVGVSVCPGAGESSAGVLVQAGSGMRRRVANARANASARASLRPGAARLAGRRG